MRHTALALLFAAFSSLAFAQAPAYQPETFQQGKDVVWVPTPQGELTLKQTFQNLSGTLTSGGASFPLEGKVRGEDISFTVQGRNYSARMNGKNLELR